MDDVYDTESRSDDAYGELNERAQRMLEGARQRLEPIDEWIRTIARDHPVAALAGAVGLGYVVGRLLARR